MENADLQKALKRLPHGPGVYLYKNTVGQVLYVGKAVDLYRRVRQYFLEDSHAAGAKTQSLVSQIATIDTIGTTSEFDALTLEAQLIRTYMPKYNSIAKDDKSSLYVIITFHEKLPHILFVRRREIVNIPNITGDFVIGPFQSARIARTLLGKIRSIVPFCTQKRRNGKPCFYTHIGLCTPCPSHIAQIKDGAVQKKLITQYRSNMFRIRDILSGKSTSVLRIFERQMKQYAQHKQYEDAEIVKQHIHALYQLITKRFDPEVYMQSEAGIIQIVENELTELIGFLQPYFPSLTSLDRIECMDISNTIGREATGSLVVLTAGRIDTSEYRKFKIRTAASPNDTAMMGEIMSRRLTHLEWKYPDLFIVDGGKGQVQAALDVLARNNLSIPLVGLAKRNEEIIIRHNNTFKTLRLPLTSQALHVMTRIRDEAHRFAINYHRILRSKASLAASRV